MNERVDINASDSTFNGASTALTVRQTGTGDIANFYDGANEIFSIIDGGYVGIGTSTPLSKLTVYGDLLLEGANRYINFGTTTNIGDSGYGIRDLNGQMQYKNVDGSWVAIGSAGAGGDLGSLSDITITTAQLGDVLSYDGGEWVNTASTTYLLEESFKILTYWGHSGFFLLRKNTGMPAMNFWIYSIRDTMTLWKAPIRGKSTKDICP